jgi:hypothetical protein
MFKFGVFFISNDMNTLEVFSGHFNKEEARKALNYQLNRLSNNENQATANIKDGFHFYVKNIETGKEEKRAMFISRIYQGKNKPYTGVKAKETAKELFYSDTYFKYESLEEY